MTLVLPTSRIYRGSTPLGAMYEGEEKLWEPFAQTWSPATVSGLLMWYDAEQVVAAEGAQVPSWLDLSGNNLHAWSTNANVIYHADGINGHPALWFGEQGFAQMTVSPGRSVGDRTIFMVVKSMGSQFGNYHNMQVQELPPYVQTYAASGIINSYADPNLSSGRSLTGACQFITVWADSSIPRHSLEVDGVRVDAPTWNPPYASDAPFFIGGFVPGNYAMNAFMGEFLLYERSLSDVERAQVQDYLTAKWGL